MSRHRSPSGRHGRTATRRHTQPSRTPARRLRLPRLPGLRGSADRRSITIGLAAFATGAIVLTSAALVAAPVEDDPAASSSGAPALAAPDPRAPVAAAAPTGPPTGPPTTARTRTDPPEPRGDSPAAAAPSRRPSPTGTARATAARPAPGAKVALVGCSRNVSNGAAFARALASAAPGDKICATGDMGGQRLNITRSGTTVRPITVAGDGRTAVKGITVKASHVVVDGFSAVGPAAPGIEMEGDDITVQNNSVSRPTGGDYDGLRFFGDNLKILNNRISDISPGGTGAHADCMQTFQNDTPSSKNVVISGNRCERVDNMCLMAEGPGDLGDGGAGEGESANWTFSDNYCDTHASQALMIEAVQNVTVTGNQIVGKVDKAFAFDIGSTGARVSGNKLASGISYEVGMDSSSRKGYLGPAVGGGP